MAKEKANIRKAELMLERVEYTPKNQDGTPVVYKTGEPVIKVIYQINLNVLGKLHQFRVITKGRNEDESITQAKLLDDFFKLKETSKLPVKIEKNEFKSPEGNIVVSYAVLCQLDERDNIHVVRLYCLDSDKTIWNMAIAEIAQGYVLPAKYSEIRKKNYEAAKKNKEGKGNEKESKEISSAGSDELPF